MTEEPKGVTVQTITPHGHVEDRHHPEGLGIEVIDGHLHVNKEGPHTIAIYVPGTWKVATLK